MKTPFFNKVFIYDVSHSGHIWSGMVFCERAGSMYMFVDIKSKRRCADRCESEEGPFSHSRYIA